MNLNKIFSGLLAFFSIFVLFIISLYLLNQFSNDLNKAEKEIELQKKTPCNWDIEKWSACSIEGIQTRKIFKLGEDGNRDESFICDASNKEPSQQSCGDEDKDGFVDEKFGGGDCDDLDSLKNPNANDVPDDGVDQNCDGRDEVSEKIDRDIVWFQKNVQCQKEENCQYSKYDVFSKDVEWVAPNEESFKSIYRKSLRLEQKEYMEGYLYVEASVNSWALNNWDSIYFNIFSNISEYTKKGHLLRSQALINNSDSIGSIGKTRLVFDLSEIPYIEIPYDKNKDYKPTGDLLKKINEDGEKFIISYISASRNPLPKVRWDVKLYLK